jgi:hypothetical protein
MRKLSRTLVLGPELRRLPAVRPPEQRRSPAVVPEVGQRSTTVASDGLKSDAASIS